MASVADDIAYHSHDLDDGMRARLFGPDDLAHLPVVGEAVRAARIASLDVPPPRLRHETIRRVIDAMVTDLLAETRRRLAKLAPKDAGCDTAVEAAGGGVRRGDGRGEPGDQGFSACPDVSPLAGEPDDHQGAPADRGAVSAAARRIRSLLPDDWRARAGEARHAARGDDRRGLRGGDDGSVRDGRVPAADRSVGVGVSLPTHVIAG